MIIVPFLVDITLVGLEIKSIIPPEPMFPVHAALIFIVAGSIFFVYASVQRVRCVERDESDILRRA